jgi:hypothetical protein
MQLFFDTSIKCQLVYERSAWRTLAGTPGDVKEVKAATIADAIVNNPGWAQDTDSDGMVIGGAMSSGSGAVYGSEVGANEAMLEHDDLPSFNLELATGWGVFPGQFQNGPQAPGVQPITTGVTGSPATTANFEYTGAAQTGVDVRQPTKYYWRVVKQ